jgi:hypothetical protein
MTIARTSSANAVRGADLSARFSDEILGHALIRRQSGVAAA